MSRFKDAELILAAITEWKDRCLLAERSLFSEQRLWTHVNFQELQEVYVKNLEHDSSEGSFLDKLRHQLQPASGDAKCLWAEMTWVVGLIASRQALTPTRKRDRIRDIWQWSGRRFPDDHRLVGDEVLGAGVVKVGLAYNANAWREYRFFVAAMLAWYSLDPGRRTSLLEHPWDFASWLDATEYAGNRMFRHVVLFLLFPDEYEPAIATDHKTKIVKRLHEGQLPERAVEIDQAILEVRRRLEQVAPGHEVHFFHQPFVEFWQRKRAEAWFQGRFGDQSVWQMNMNVVGEDMWPRVAEAELASIGWDDMEDLRTPRDDIRKDLIGRGYGDSPTMRSLFLWEFANAMNVGDIVVATRKGGRLLGCGVVTSDYRYDADGGTHRVHTRGVRWHVCAEETPLLSGPVAVKRLTRFDESKWWVRLAFWLMGDPELAREDRRRPPVSGSHRADPDPYGIDDAHRDLFLRLRDFKRLITSIKARKNLILQGPPGTGKTFIARRLAWCLIGRKDSEPIEMVQFHQSYAYEDFVQGFRPNKTGGFDLKDGVFHRFCERASANRETPHVFIIDEINRGNLSRIFGELLMLIEADKRSEEYAVVLTYSDEPFHVPANVYILGMMNTADRSLALVDYALRRRFAFETLEPAYGEDYGRAEFEKYLTAKGANPNLATRISDRMAKLNDTIRSDKELGRGFQIGHSYFVPVDGDVPSEDWYKDIVETQIAPLLREYWFDSPGDVEKEVARLMGGS